MSVLSTSASSNRNSSMAFVLTVVTIFSLLLFLSITEVYAESINSQKTLDSTVNVTENLTKVMLGLTIVILSIFGSAWFFRRFGNINTVTNESLKIIGGLSIGQKDKILLIQVADEQILVAVSQNGMRTLHVLNNPIKTDSESQKTESGFSSHLNAALEKWQNK